MQKPSLHTFGMHSHRKIMFIVIIALVLQPLVFFSQLIPVVKAANPNINSENGSLSAQDLTINGESTGDKFGSTVTNIGDVNDDGREDFAMSAPNADESVTIQGGGITELDPVNTIAPTFVRQYSDNLYDYSNGYYDLSVDSWNDSVFGGGKNAYKPLVIANITYRKSDPGATITSVTYDSAPLTFICKAERGELVSALYYIQFDDNDNFESVSSINFQFGASVNTVSAASYVLENVGDNIIGASACTTGNSSTAAVTVASSNKEYVIGAVSVIPQSYSPITPNVPEAWSHVNFNGNTGYASNLASSGSRFEGNSPSNLTWSLDQSQDWVAVAVSIKGGINNGNPNLQFASTSDNLTLLSASNIAYANSTENNTSGYNVSDSSTGSSNIANHYYGESIAQGNTSWTWGQGRSRPWVASGVSLRPACYVSGGVTTYFFDNSVSQYSWPSSESWYLNGVPSGLDLSSVVINFTWHTDSSPEQGSLYLYSSYGTSVQLIDGNTVSANTSTPYSVAMNDFSGDAYSEGSWQLYMTDSGSDGGHYVTDIAIGFGGEPNSTEPASCASPTLPTIENAPFTTIDESYGSSTQTISASSSGLNRFMVVMVNYYTENNTELFYIYRSSFFTKLCSVKSNGMVSEIYYQASPSTTVNDNGLSFSNSNYRNLSVKTYSLNNVNSTDAIDGFSCDNQGTDLSYSLPTVESSSANHTFSGGTSTTSFNYETTASTDTVLVFSAAYHNGFSDTAISSVSYNGQSLTAICSATNNDFAAEQWYLAAPPVGNHTLEVQFTNSDMNSFLSKVIEVSGVSTENPIVSSSCEGEPNFTGANTTIDIDTTVSSGNNQLVVATAASYALTFSNPNGITEIANNAYGNVTAAIGYKSSSNGSTAIGWTGDYDWPWSISAVVLRPTLPTTTGDLIFGGTDSGQVYIFFGRNTSNWGSSFTVPANANASLIGESTNDLLGYSNVEVASGPSDLNTGNKSITKLGDVNGDTIDDFAVSAPGYANGDGKVYIILGKTTGWAMNMVVSTESVASFESEQTESKVGYAIEGIGDANGDSFNDLAISAPFYDSPSKTDNGKVYIINGMASGWQKDLPLSSADGSIVGRISGDKLGKTLAGVTNVIGDSKADFAIGAPNASFSGTEHGTVYLIDGRATWTNNAVVTTVADSTIHGEADYDLFGFGLTYMGDFNGDARGDFAASSIYHSQSVSGEGKVYLFLGKSGGAGWGTDVNAGTDSSASLIGECDSCYAGWMLAGGSDVDGDNRDDLLILSAANSSGADREVHVIFGQTAAVGQNAGINSLAETGSNLASDLNWIAALGDINNDGFQEYAGSSSSNNSNTGRVVVVLGEAKFIEGGNEEPGPGNGLVPLNDPYLQWVKTFGSATGNVGTSRSETDRYGNVFIRGTFQGTNIDFDPGVGVDSHTSTVPALFLSKYSPAGTYLWTRVWIATELVRSDGGFALDSVGNSYVSGVAKGTIDLDSTAGVDQKTTVGTVPSFITKYDADGNYLQSIFIDAPVGFALYNTISIDSEDNMYAGGVIVGTFDLDSTAGVDTITSAGSEDAFVTKYSKDGSYVWTKMVATSANRNGSTYAEIYGDHLYVSTYQETGTTDFDPSAGTFELTAVDVADTLAKYDLDGNLIWARIWQKSAYPENVYYVLFNDINVASNGDVYLVGVYYGTTDFDPGVGTAVRSTTSLRDFDAFILKLNSAGEFQWVSTVSTPVDGLNENYNSVVPTNTGEVYVGGRVFGNGQFRSENGNVAYSANGRDGVISRYDSDGNLEGGWYMTAGGDSSSSRISISNIGGEKYLNVSGIFSGTHDADLLDTTSTITSLSSSPNADIYIAKYKLIDRVKIDNLDPTLSATATGLGISATEDSSKLNFKLDNAPKQVEVRDTGNNAVLGEIDVALTTVANWADVSGDSDIANGRSFLHKTAGTWSAGDVIISNSFSLYIPKLPGHSAVKICPGADSFGDLAVDCPSGYLVSEANENVEIVNIEGQDYWKVDGVNGTGGFGLTAANLVITPSYLPTSTANTITLNYLPSGNYSDDDQINVIYNSQYSGTITSGDVTITKTGDANFVGATTSNFTATGFTITLDTTADLDNLNDFEIVINGLTTPINANNYAWTISAPEGEGLSTLQYVGSENQLNVIGRVDPTLTLLIRNTADTADQSNIFGASGPNLCNLGNLSDVGVQTCSYRLKVTTNSASGYVVNVQTDGNLRKGSDFIDNVVEDINNVASGNESYGIELQVGTATEGTVTESGIFNDNDSPLGNGTNTALYSSSGPNNPSTTDTVNTALVTHRAEAGSSTPAGTYTQLVTYTVSASF